MGLDMYLHRHTYVKNWEHTPEDKRFDIAVLQGGAPFTGIDSKKIKTIVEEVAYWRKANQVHAWFVKNVQDGKDECQESYVSEGQIRQLREQCERVLADHSLAETLLPSQPGFFFGSTDYDEYYFANLECTVKQLSEILENPGAGEVYYHASW